MTMKMKMQSAREGRDRAEVQPKTAPCGGRATDTARPRTRSGRESVESFVIVFLAFMTWSLEAEGFVIPTGSMAPTLMGRHKEVVCPQCGYRYAVNADREVETAGRVDGASQRIIAGTCANCRFECQVGDLPSFSGDRIYVVKDGLSLPFLGSPRQAKLKRWDVAVFKLPEEPEVRYIKRLVGMPNEIVRIEAGDLWSRPVDQSRELARLRRTPDHQRAMQMMVYDDRHRASALAGDARWARWTPGPGSPWTEKSPGCFVSSIQGRDWSDIRYHHRVPSPAQWEAIRAGAPVPGTPRSTLITDFYSYNTDRAPDDLNYPRRAARPWFHPHWVGDLTLSLRLKVGQAAGQFRLELIKSGMSNRCEIDLATGTATVWHREEQLGPAVTTAISRPGEYEITFANVDDRLTLWVDGALPFGDGRNLDSAAGLPKPTSADLEPGRVAALNASIEIDRLVLERDVYYTHSPSEPDYQDLSQLARVDPEAFFDLLSDPAQFAALSHPTPRDYPLGPDRYLMLGDNSPWSRDARAWGRADQIDPDVPGVGWDATGRERWEVPEALLVGKAFCVYWPHAKPVWPELRFGPDLRLPIRPYFEQMRWIR
jgi:signal peptidase I